MDRWPGAKRSCCPQPQPVKPLIHEASLLQHRGLSLNSHIPHHHHESQEKERKSQVISSAIVLLNSIPHSFRAEHSFHPRRSFLSRIFMYAYWVGVLYIQVTYQYMYSDSLSFRGSVPQNLRRSLDKPPTCPNDRGLPRKNRTPACFASLRFTHRFSFLLFFAHTPVFARPPVAMLRYVQGFLVGWSCVS